MIRRFFVSIVSCFEAAVARIENHEALANAAIADLEQATVRAQSELKKVRGRREQVESEQAKQEELANTWENRARAVAETDRAKALECMSRRKGAINHAEHLGRSIERFRAVEGQIERDAARCRELLDEARRRASELTAMSSHRSALDAVAGVAGDGGLPGTVEQLFGRWEESLGVLTLDRSEPDTFAAKFEREESSAALEAELETLLAR